MRLQKLVLLSFLTLSTLSCGSLNSGTGVTKSTSEKFEATNPSSVEIYFSSRPEKQFIELGSVSVLRIKSMVWPSKKKAEDIQKEMKELAASIGGNAIIDYRESGETNMTGTVIRFK